MASKQSVIAAGAGPLLVVVVSWAVPGIVAAWHDKLQADHLQARLLEVKQQIEMEWQTQRNTKQELLRLRNWGLFDDDGSDTFRLKASKAKLKELRSKGSAQAEIAQAEARLKEMEELFAVVRKERSERRGMIEGIDASKQRIANLQTEQERLQAMLSKP